MAWPYCCNCFHPYEAGALYCKICGCPTQQDWGKYPTALPYGTVLAGRYITGRILGQGGFGITYIAHDYVTKQRVAIKEFFPDTLAHRGTANSIVPYTGQRAEDFQYGKNAFLAEARTLAQLVRVPGVVQVHSYFEEFGTAYFSMELVDGVNLQTYLDQNGGRLPWETAKRILVPVMDALCQVHSRGIIHRDIKPDNIYLSWTGEVKLLDFGSARYSMGEKSRSLDVVLTHGFAPKEQYSRHGRQGPYTDVYALAATFYYVLTSQKPQDAIDRMDHDDLVPPRYLGARIPKTAELALTRALAVDAGDRFPDMVQFRQALLTGEREYWWQPTPNTPYAVPPMQQSARPPMQPGLSPEKQPMRPDTAPQMPQSIPAQPPQMPEPAPTQLPENLWPRAQGNPVVPAQDSPLPTEQLAPTDPLQDETPVQDTPPEIQMPPPMNTEALQSAVQVNVSEQSMPMLTETQPSVPLTPSQVQGSDRTVPANPTPQVQGSDRTAPINPPAPPAPVKPEKKQKPKKEKAAGGQKQPDGAENPADTGKNASGKKKLHPLLIVLFSVLGLALIALILFLTVHNYTAPTCTQTAYCTICGRSSGAPLGHDWIAATCTQPKTCRRCGKTEGNKLGHNMQPATCEAPKTCSRCGKTEGKALGHNWKAATCDKPKTCSRCGKTEGAALGHSYRAATYDKPATCSRCGKTTGDVLGYVGTVTGKWDNDKKISLQGWDVQPYEISTNLSRCFKLTISLRVTNCKGNPFGSWSVYARDDRGNWTKIKGFTLSKSDVDSDVTVEIKLDNPMTITALICVPPQMDSEASFSDNMTITFAQCRVD